MIADGRPVGRGGTVETMTNLTLARPATVRAGVALIVAPVLLLAAWVILWPLDGRAGPGLGWTASHLSWIAAFALLAYACVHVRRHVRAAADGRQTGVDLAAAVTMVGLAAGTAQMVVDLVAGFWSSTRAEIDALSDQITDAPGVDLLLYDLGPLLFFVGMFALLALAAVRRQVGPASPALFLGGFVLIAVDDALSPIGLAALWLALLPLALRLTRG